MVVNGVRIGDPLRDNAYKPNNNRKLKETGQSRDKRLIEIDGYRFHDSIHFAFVAILGWSPVVRGLMKRKRKTISDIDDADDGARAQIVEEMIVKLTHSYAVGIDKKRLMDDEKHVSFDLLKQIFVLADGLEVAGGRPDVTEVQYWEWEEAILEGYRVFNELRRHGKGRLRVDLEKRAISFYQLRHGEEDYFPFDEKPPVGPVERHT